MKVCRNALILLCALLFGVLGAQPENAERYALLRVSDGDTIVVQGQDGQEQRVRLVGLDCLEVSRDDRLRRQAAELGLTVSEAQAFGLQARIFVEKALSDRVVYLDPDNPRIDRYGRLRAYAWSSDGTLLQVQLLATGLALPDDYEKKPEYLAKYEEAARVAQSEGLGIWHTDDVPIQVEASGTPDATKVVTYRRRRPSRPPRTPFSLFPMFLVGAGLALLVYAFRTR